MGQTFVKIAFTSLELLQLTCFLNSFVHVSNRLEELFRQRRTAIKCTPFYVTYDILYSAYETGVIDEN